MKKMQYRARDDDYDDNSYDQVQDEDEEGCDDQDDDKESSLEGQEEDDDDEWEEGDESSYDDDEEEEGGGDGDERDRGGGTMSYGNHQSGGHRRLDRNGRQAAPSATAGQGRRQERGRRQGQGQGEGRGRRKDGARSPLPRRGNLPLKKAKENGGGMMKSVGSATGKSMKAMVHALQPKSVGLGEILDTWKIEQVIGKAPGRLTRCAATIEFRRDGKVVTSFNGRESVSDFSFRAHAWPRSCTIEFEAKAFQGPWDEEPVWKLYKGSFSRKLLDSKIITLEGAIYDMTGKMLWKRKVKSGKFNARRRPSTKPRAAGGGGGGASRGGVNKGKGDGRSTRRSGEGATGAAAESSRKGQRGAGGGGASDPRESGQRRRRQQ
eukprot:jgi/Undpi1/11354/HiC_scaffold_30.g13651.m1